MRPATAKGGIFIRKKQYLCGCCFSNSLMTVQENPIVKFPDEYFESVFNHYSSGLLVYAKHYVVQYEVAEDVVHDVFTNFWEKKANIDGDKVKSYLFTSTRNSCLNYLARLRMKSRYQQAILQANGLPDSFDEDLYIPSEMKARIDAAIDKLPPQRKKAFVMHRFEKKTFAEIGRELNISPKTVDKHIELALKDLRAELSPYLYLLLISFFN